MKISLKATSNDKNKITDACLNKKQQIEHPEHFQCCPCNREQRSGMSMLN